MFLVFGKLFDSCVVDVLVHLSKAMVGTSSHAQTGGSGSSGKCLQGCEILVWCVEERGGRFVELMDAEVSV